MTKTRVLVIGCFLAAFVAGAVLGYAGGRFSDARREGPWLKRQLGLSAEQDKQIQSIWRSVHEAEQADRDKMRALSEQRDQEIRGLFTDEQRAKIDEILERHRQTRMELFREREARNDEAIRRTKEVLTPEQRVKYEAILEKNRERFGPPGGPPMRGPRRPEFDAKPPL